MIGIQRMARVLLCLISANEHYQLVMIKPQDVHDVEILGRREAVYNHQTNLIKSAVANKG